MTTETDLDAYDEMLEQDTYGFNEADRIALIETPERRSKKRYSPVYRKGRPIKFKPLRRPCKRCGETFQPTSKGSRICPSCDKSHGAKKKPK